MGLETATKDMFLIVFILNLHDIHKTLLVEIPAVIPLALGSVDGSVMAVNKTKKRPPSQIRDEAGGERPKRSERRQPNDGAHAFLSVVSLSVRRRSFP